MHFDGKKIIIAKISLFESSIHIVLWKCPQTSLFSKRFNELTNEQKYNLHKMQLD